ncbi:MAG: NAD(P)-binding domain-containing protein [Crocinitomicaceae bacterium]
MKRILLIGAGWLGKQITETLIKNGYEVAISSRSKEKLKAFCENCTKICVSFDQGKCIFSEDISQYEQVIICLPPIPAYADSIQSIANKLSPDTKIIFTSSTGIYEESAEIIDENSKIKHDHILWQVEKIIRNRKSYSILRLGGLIGPGRHPVKHLLTKPYLDGGKNVVNLIHSFDICSAILHVLNDTKLQSTYNLVSPHHPSRGDYYTEAAKELAEKKLVVDYILSENKQVDGSKIVKELGFNYSTRLDEWQTF